MEKLSREQLHTLRTETRKKLEKACAESTQIIVGMGTSGIAAGARETLAAFETECRQQGVDRVVIRQAGSLGLDYAEPTAEIRVPGMPDVIYGRVTPEVASRIVRKHILGGTLINDHLYDRPAADILLAKEND